MITSQSRRKGTGPTMRRPRSPEQPQMHTIFAAICQHPVRFSSVLPKSASNLDFDVPYCSNCLKRSNQYGSAMHQRVRQLCQLQQTTRWRSDFDLHQPEQGSSTRHDGLCIREASDHPGWFGLEGIVGRRIRVKFDEQHHRAENEYRRDSCFDRSGIEYEPGRWADESGEGYINTSDPYSEAPELDENSFEEDCEMAEEDEDQEDDESEYDDFSSEELAARERMLMAKIAEFKRMEQEIHRQDTSDEAST